MNAPHFHQRANLLWLWILPVAFSWLLWAGLHPAFWPAVGCAVAACVAGGFGLAWHRFSTPRRRISAGFFLAGSSLGLVFSMAFMGCLPFDYYNEPPMTPAQLEAMHRQQAEQGWQQQQRNRERVAKLLVPRDTQATDAMLDLSANYDQVLPGQNPGGNIGIRYEKPGTHVWQGIGFDVRGTVRTSWNGWSETNHIAIDRKCAEVDFLLGEEWNRTANITLGRLVIHLADGTEAIVPLVAGKDVSTSRFNPVTVIYNDENSRSNPHPSGWYQLPTNAVVWGERTDSQTGQPRPAYLYYIKRWTNPYPAKAVTGIDLEPAAVNCDLLLAAITAQPHPEGQP